MALDAIRQLIWISCLKKDARMALPQGMTTSMVITANPEAWFNFFKLRLSPKAQWEIRAVAKAILAEMNPLLPEMFGGFMDD